MEILSEVKLKVTCYVDFVS